MTKTVYVEHKPTEAKLLNTLFSVDQNWEPRPFIRKDETFVLRGSATTDQIQELKNHGFKVHVDEEQS
jgi:hypothetical protein